MDLSEFTSPASSRLNDKAATKLAWLPSESGFPSTTAYGAGDRSNWSFAALNVGFWNIAGALGLAVPAASFVESFNHDPVQQADKSWVRTYSVTALGSTYTARLVSRYTASGVRWEMYVTKQNSFADFMWYCGESNDSASEGYWLLKDKPADPSDLLRIDWRYNSSAQTADVKYTNVVPNGPENGGYIHCSTTQKAPYNRACDIYNKGKANHTYIEWSSTTREGQVKDVLHFGDSQWHRWDSSLRNTTD